MNAHDSLRLHLLAAMGLAGGCAGPDKGEVGPAETGIETADTSDTAIEQAPCPDAPRPTTDDLELVAWAEDALWLLCTAPTSGTCPSGADFDAAAYVTENVGAPPACWSDTWATVVECGPDPAIEDECCYVTQVRQNEDDYCGDGRPFAIQGRPRRASATPRAGWTDSRCLPLEHLSDTQRGVLATAWARMGRHEHAAVASFSRLNLQLLGLGAPAWLVAASTRAIADEVAHARMCFGIAEAFASTPVGPGPLDVSGAVVGPPTLADVLVETMVEGCVTETVSTALAAHARDQCSVPSIRRVLDRIVADESRHAADAWRLVQWGLRQQPRLAAHVRRAFDAALRRPLPDRTAPIDPDLLQTHGILPPAIRAAVTRSVHQQVLRPCMASLFATLPKEARHAAQG